MYNDRTQGEHEMKLTLISVTVHGIRKSAFVMLNEGATVTEDVLRKVFSHFPHERGVTFSIG